MDLNLKPYIALLAGDVKKLSSKQYYKIGKINSNILQKVAFLSNFYYFFGILVNIILKIFLIFQSKYYEIGIL